MSGDEATFWDIISATGEWAGALFSAIAIYFAVKRDKPSIRFSVLFIGGDIRVDVINDSYIPVNIVKLKIRDPKHKKDFLNNTDSNKLLGPGEKATIAELKETVLSVKGFKNRQEILEMISVYDQFGKEYFIKNTIKAKLKRFFGINLFGKTNKKNRQAA
ncbi:MAG: hypothetical protein GT589_08745 [Peptoclostridium sp.]|uniref:hypothetical protein n=1 Tax=Peptoclostridium sp. TaxID=1904860 RepID=UPI00139B2112|nr:hypothetical protein [Peptoclostridium sp.]MZQ76220.1 hypothetical protein [Peptoclostridium sp.]